MFFQKYLLLFFISFVIVTKQISCSTPPVEDELDVDDDTVDIEPDNNDETEASIIEDEEGGTGGTIGKSTECETNILFLKPKSNLIGNSGVPELYSGKIVEYLIGFINHGKQDYIIETLDTSFRYPQDYTFHIQNFTTINYGKTIKSNEQITLSYSFFVDESFAGRPFGLSINLGYRDLEGKPYLDAVYNETINIIELEEGLDGETFFLYIFFAACIVLLLVIGQHVLTSFSKKITTSGGGNKSKSYIEKGSNETDDVDFEWIPKQTLREINRNTSPKQSPRQKKVK